MGSTTVLVGASPIQGLGVFAGGEFDAGEVVMTIDDARVVDDDHPVDGGDAVYCDYLGGGRVVLMQSPERHINHSCDPNVWVCTREDGVREEIALRPIRAQEEITYDYSINGSGDTVWTCLCGSPRCRHAVHSDFFDLPLALQREYLPLLDEWFRRERPEQIEALQRRLQAPASATGLQPG